MRGFYFVYPMVLLSACSIIEQPFLNDEPSLDATSSHGNYAPCQLTNACIIGQGHTFSTAHNTSQNVRTHGQNFNAPLVGWHVNPTSYDSLQPRQAPDVFYAYGNSGYGQNRYGPNPHRLRGMHNPKPGNLYGTWGGVLYNKDIDVFGIEGRIGYDSGRILGGEIEGSIGVLDEKKTIDNPLIGNVELNTGFNYNVAAFALARLPVSQRLSVHGRTGYDFRRLTVDGTAQDGTFVSESRKFDGLAYGAGVEYALSPRSGLRFDLTRYDNDIGGINSVSASFSRKF